MYRTGDATARADHRVDGGQRRVAEATLRVSTLRGHHTDGQEISSKPSRPTREPGMESFSGLGCPVTELVADVPEWSLASNGTGAVPSWVERGHRCGLGLYQPLFDFPV